MIDVTALGERGSRILFQITTRVTMGEGVSNNLWRYLSTTLNPLVSPNVQIKKFQVKQNCYLANAYNARHCCYCCCCSMDTRIRSFSRPRRYLEVQWTRFRLRWNGSRSKCFQNNFEAATLCTTTSRGDRSRLESCLGTVSTTNGWMSLLRTFDLLALWPCSVDLRRQIVSSRNLSRSVRDPRDVDFVLTSVE